MAGQPALAKRLGWTFLILCCYRIGVHVPVPGVDGANVVTAEEAYHKVQTGEGLGKHVRHPVQPLRHVLGRWPA